MDRREFFKTGLKKLFQAADKVQEWKEKVPKVLSAAIQEEVQLEKQTEPSLQNKTFKNLVFPPGAVKPKREFISKCTGCGDCISVCPYNAIFPVYEEKYNKSLPYMDVNMNPCYMCFNYPCIQSCKYNALEPFLENEKPKFGKAKLIFKNCLNSDEMYECDLCEKTCPIENVVSIKNKKPKFSKDCTGCGLCVKVCPVFPKAIVVK